MSSNRKKKKVMNHYKHDQLYNDKYIPLKIPLYHLFFWNGGQRNYCNLVLVKVEMSMEVHKNGKYVSIKAIPTSKSSFPLELILSPLFTSCSYNFLYISNFY